MKRSTVVLVLVAIAVGIGVWLDRDRPSTDEARVQSGRLLPGFEAAGAGAFQLERGGRTLRFEKLDGKWWLQPGKQRADDAQVESLLATVEYATVERRLSPDAALRKNSGLDPPRARLIFDGKTLAVGGEAAGSRGIYVERLGEIVVTDRRLGELCESDDRLRLQRVVLDEPGDSSTVAIGKLALERRAGSWRVVQPRSLRADTGRVQSLLEVLARTRAAAMVDGPAPSPAPDDEAILLDGKLQARLRWKGGCGNLPQAVLAARADGAVLCFAAEDLQPLRAVPESLRDPRLSPFRADEVQSIDLVMQAGERGPPSLLAVRREGPAWRITAPADAIGPADSTAVRELLAGWEELRARRFGAAGNTLGSLRLRTGSDEVSLELGRGSSELTARRVGEDEALLFPQKTLALFDADPLKLRARRLFSFASADVAKIVIDRGDKLTVEPGGERWPALIGALEGLRVESWTRRAFSPRGTLTVQLSRGTSPSLVLGPHDEDGCLVRLPADKDGVAGLIKPEVCALLWK